MADEKLTALTALDAFATGDLLYTVDNPGGTPLSKKATIDQAKTFIVGAGSVSIASGKTLTGSNTLTLAGTDATTMTFPATSGTVATLNTAQTFTALQTLNRSGEQLALGSAGSNSGVMSFAGSTSGKVTVQAAAAAGTYTLTLPVNDGDSGQFLQTNGSGVTSWATASGGSGSPGGSTTQIQYNNAGSFGGMSGTAWDDTNRALTITGATLTADAPVLNLTQTWNAGAVTFTGIKLNITNTASGGSSLLQDWQIGGVSYAKIATSGTLTTVNISTGSANASTVTSSGNIWINSNTAPYFLGTSADLILSRRGAANLRLGAADAASAVPQLLSVQSVVAGTTNTAGQNFTITGSQGTGTGAGGSIIFQVAPAGSSGSAQNALAAALTIASNRTVIVGAAFTVATLPAAGTQGRRAWVTDATVPTFLGTLTGGGSVVCPVFDNGTAWVSA